MKKTAQTTRQTKVYKKPLLSVLKLSSTTQLMRSFSTIEFEIDDFVDGEDL